MKITNDEAAQIKRFAGSSSIRNLALAAMRSLDERSISKIVASYLYFKSSGRPDSDFVGYVGTKEIWSTLAIGLNVAGAFLPAFILDKEFRILVVKTGINKGLEIGSKAASSRISRIPAKKSSPPN